MRVKTVPRQRITPRNKTVESVSETASESLEKSSSNGGQAASKGAEDELDGTDESAAGNSRAKRSENRDMNDEKKKEALDYSTKALDMSMKRKEEVAQKNTSNHRSMAGPSSCCENSYSLSEEDHKETASSDYNNNTLSSVANAANCCSPAGPSSRERSKCQKEESKGIIPMEAVNLCKKDCHEEDPPNPRGCADDRLKDTFLYKIMTDPTFLESIQKHKQPKRYVCQFCKQEFPSSDELADHMYVKKDESNQVVCCACRKTFAQKRYLRYHQRCHSERAKFTCDICTKKYSRLDNLTRHNAFHVNPDKFSCSYCEKTFARKDLLNKHLKCHDNKYRFFCDTCQKFFKSPLTLDNHKKFFHSAK